MATFYLYDEIVRYCFDPSLIVTSGGAKAAVDFNSDSFKVALSNTACNATTQAADSTLSAITQIAAGNGYTTGGSAAATPTFAETGAGTGIWQFTTADVVFTASGGNIAQFQYVVLYDDSTTSPADVLIGFLNYGSAVDVTTGNTFTVNVGSNGWFQITVPNAA